MFSQRSEEYERLHGSNSQDQSLTDNNECEDETIIHLVPEANKSLWNHIEDLDSFFSRIYSYHQRHGFICILTQEILDLSQFIFVVFFTVFLLQCVDYPVLFRDKAYNSTTTAKIKLDDALIPASVCLVGIPPFLTTCIIISTFFWIFRVTRFIYHIVNYWEIRKFYQLVLNVKESELDNFTWNEVQAKLRQAQRDHLMCIHKVDLTDLDIHHRILRFTNYFVAMVNKNVLPVKYKLPILGDVIFLTKGLKYNLELVLFWGVGAPFDSSWHLLEEYKRPSRRQELAEKLSRRMRTVGLLNLVMAPLVIIWQLLHSVFRYAEELKRDPSLLGVRKWSLYGRFYLRHFNELDHELEARLSRAYWPASKYMRAFSSPLMSILARHFQFVFGSILAVLICLTVWDEDVITVEHVITFISVLGAGIALSASFIPDENTVYFHDDLLSAVLAHVHYLPAPWIEKAHMSKVRAGFAQLFQLKAGFLVEELLSPVITPFILLFHLPRASLKIVDFLRNHTVDVVGVGDVCSFAQLDVGRHGDPKYQSFKGSVFPEHQEDGSLLEKSKILEQPVVSAEEGKTELSLVHFALTNPDWKPPNSSQNFLESLHRHIQTEPIDPVIMGQSEEMLRSVLSGAQQPWGRSFLASDAHSMSPISGYQSVVQPPFFNIGRVSYRPGTGSIGGSPSRSAASKLDTNSSAVQGNYGQSTSHASSIENGNARELASAVEMARSALFIHGARRRRSSGAERLPNIIEAESDRSPVEQEMSPLLRLARST